MQDVLRFDGSQFVSTQGDLSRIFVGHAGSIWGLGSGDIGAYRFDSASKYFVEVSSDKFSHIAPSQDGPRAWAISYSGALLTYDLTQQTFVEFPFPGEGRPMQVAMGGGSDVWVLTLDMDAGFMQTYRFDDKLKTFQQIPKALVQISVGLDGTVWGIAADSNLVKFEEQSGTFYEFDGGYSSVEVGNVTNVWALLGSSILRLDSSGFVGVKGSLQSVYASANGSAWGINSKSEIFRYNSSLNVFEQIPGNATSLGIGSDGDVWIIDPYRRAG